MVQTLLEVTSKFEPALEFAAKLTRVFKSVNELN